MLNRGIGSQASAEFAKSLIFNVKPPNLASKLIKGWYVPRDCCRLVFLRKPGTDQVLQIVVQTGAKLPNRNLCHRHRVNKRINPTVNLHVAVFKLGCAVRVIDDIVLDEPIVRQYEKN